MEKSTTITSLVAWASRFLHMPLMRAVSLAIRASRFIRHLYAERSLAFNFFREQDGLGGEREPALGMGIKVPIGGLLELVEPTSSPSSWSQRSSSVRGPYKTSWSSRSKIYSEIDIRFATRDCPSNSRGAVSTTGSVDHKHC